MLHRVTETEKAPSGKRGLFQNGGGAEIRTPDTADMSRML